MLAIEGIVQEIGPGGFSRKAEPGVGDQCLAFVGVNRGSVIAAGGYVASKLIQ
jgi:hypothetical protein